VSGNDDQDVPNDPLLSACASNPFSASARWCSQAGATYPPDHGTSHLCTVVDPLRRRACRSGPHGFEPQDIPARDWPIWRSRSGSSNRRASKRHATWQLQRRCYQANARPLSTGAVGGRIEDCSAVRGQRQTGRALVSVPSHRSSSR
jgi:hypothetical protein